MLLCRYVFIAAQLWQWSFLPPLKPASRLLGSTCPVYIASEGHGLRIARVARALGLDVGLRLAGRMYVVDTSLLPVLKRGKDLPRVAVSGPPVTVYTTLLGEVLREVVVLGPAVILPAACGSRLALVLSYEGVLDGLTPASTPLRLGGRGDTGACVVEVSANTIRVWNCDPATAFELAGRGGGEAAAPEAPLWPLL